MPVSTMESAKYGRHAACASIGGQNELAPPQTIRRPGQRDPLDLAA